MPRVGLLIYSEETLNPAAFSTCFDGMAVDGLVILIAADVDSMQVKEDVVNTGEFEFDDVLCHSFKSKKELVEFVNTRKKAKGLFDYDQVAIFPAEDREYFVDSIVYDTLIEIPKDSVEQYSMDESASKMAAVVHMYWSGPSFSYANRVAVETALDVHCPAKLNLWTVNPPDGEHWDYVKNLDGVSVVDLHDEFSSAHFDTFNTYFETIEDYLADHREHARHAQLKDFFMWYILKRRGGIFLDMDTISYSSVWSELRRVDEGQLALGGSARSGATGFLAYNRPTEEAGAVDGIISHMLMRMETIEKRVDDLSEWNCWTYLGPTLIREYNKIEDGDGLEELPVEWFYKWASDADYSLTEGIEEDDLNNIKVLHYYLSGRDEMGCDVRPEDIDLDYIRTVESPYSVIASEVLGIDTEYSGRNNNPITISKDDVAKDPDNPFITLSMVVGDPPVDKLKECLRSLEPITDKFIISYNGEDAATLKCLASFFNNNSIEEIPDEAPYEPGYRVYQRDWEGYLKSRNEALDLAEKHMQDHEFILKMDPDEYLRGGLNLRAMARASDPDVIDTYCYGDTRFKFHRLWKKSTGGRYKGRYHEIPVFDNADETVLMTSGEADVKPATEADPGGGSFVIHDSEDNSSEKEQLGMALLRQDIIETERTDERIPRLYFYAGRDTMRAELLEESAHWFNKRLDMWDSSDDPRLVERFFTLLYLGHNYRDQGRVEDASSCYTKAVSLFPEAREGWYYLSKIIEEELSEQREDWLELMVVVLRGCIAADSVPEDMPMFVQNDLYTDRMTTLLCLKLADMIMSIDDSSETAAMVMPIFEGLSSDYEDVSEEIASRKESLSEMITSGFKDSLPDVLEDLMT